MLNAVREMINDFISYIKFCNYILVSRIKFIKNY